MPGAHLETMLTLLRRQGPTPAGQLQQTLGISQPTLSRFARAAGSRLVRMGRARATRYAVWREVAAVGHSWPVYRIDAGGRAHLASHLHALAPRTWWYDSTDPAPALLHGEFADGLFPGLPWFLDDMRPQGFMGRAFARRHGEMLGLGHDPSDWSADGVLVALLRFGDDMPGDFVIGDTALERFQRAALRPSQCVPVGHREERYVALAQAALAGDLPASSAGGEQAKFIACVEEEADRVRHVIVKFSPVRDTAAGRRWADLLVCEHLAAESMRAHGLSACETTVSEAGGRCFLEVTRFDRVGRHGRRGFVSLMPLANAYHGALDTWVAAADRLQRDGWLGRDDADTLRLLWWFGGLIRNTDMHFGNVSLALDASRPLALAPAYDMLPMHYRPTSGGEVLVREYEPPLPPPAQRPHWSRAADIAMTFWGRAAAAARLSDDFRAEAAGVLDATRSLRDRLG